MSDCKRLASLCLSLVLLALTVALLPGPLAASQPANTDTRETTALSGFPTEGLSWVKYYDLVERMSATDMAEIAGGYLISGQVRDEAAATWDGLVVKLDRLGDVVWAKRMPGADGGFLLPLSDGFILSGRISYPDFTSQGWLARFDDDGQLVWQHIYPHTAIFMSGAPLSDDHFLVIGNNNDECTASCLMKIAPDGQIVWSWSGLASPANPGVPFLSIRDIYPLGEDRYVIRGFMGASGGALLLIDGHGTIEQVLEFDGRTYLPHDVVDNGRGGFVVAGEYVLAPGSTACWAMSVNHDGTVAWSEQYLVQGAFQRSISSIEAVPGGYLIDCFEDLWVQMIDHAGQMVWHRQYSLTGSDRLTALIRTGDGGLLRLTNGVNNDIVLLKSFASGELYNCAVAKPAATFQFATPLTTLTPHSAIPITHTMAISPGAHIASDIVLQTTAVCQPPVVNARQHLPMSSRPDIVLNLALDEGFGSTFFNDDSGYEHHGSCASATCPLSIGSPRERALQFDGLDDFVTLGNPPELNRLAGAVTIAAWVRPESGDGLQNIIAHGFATTPYGEIYLRINNGAYEVGVWAGLGYAAMNDVPAGDYGSWVHLAGVYDGEEWHLYRKGVWLSSVVAPYGALAVDEAWALGARGDGAGRFFAGAIDEVIIYARALSPAEIVVLAQQ